MANTDIKKQTILEDITISNEHYFQSLLQVGYQYEILTQQEIEEIQGACMHILKVKIEEYTLGESSSVRTDVASYIMESIFYTIGIHLKTVHNPELALEMLQQEDLFELYNKGLMYLKRKVSSTKSVYLLIKQNCLKTENQTYVETLQEGLAAFFKVYSPDFGAHDTHITVDYPVAIPMQDVAGIEYIQQYIEKLQIEDAFCRYFEPVVLHYLLSGYGLDENYQELIFNIFEQVFTTALFCQIVGKNVLELELLDRDKSMLHEIFNDKSKDEIIEILEKSCQHLFENLEITSERNQHYLRLVLQPIAKTIVSTLELKTFEKMCITLKRTQQVKKIYYDLGEKMPSASYRLLVEELNQCRFTADKVSIIQQQVHTLSDLVDVLLDVEFEEVEIYEVLQTMQVMDLAALASEIASYPEFDELEFDELEQVLYRQVKSFIKTLAPEQQQQIQAIKEMYTK